MKILPEWYTFQVESGPFLNYYIHPYLQIEQANWGERYVYELFKADVGFDEPITLHRAQPLLLKNLVEGINIALSAPTSFR